MNCRGIPGNIGTLRARIQLYDHYPFWARPYQNVAFPFTVTAGAEIVGEHPPKTKNAPIKRNTPDKENVIFQDGAAYLNPLDIPFSNFMATIKKVDGEPLLDLVGENQSPNITEHLPGGAVYENNDSANDHKTTGKTMFPHLLWIYEGSAFYNTNVIHPSDYNVAIDTQQGALSQMQVSLRKLLIATDSSPKWEMVSEDNSKESEQLNRVYPAMISRKGCRQCPSMHWTIRKYTQLFQGQDFSIELKRIDPILHEWSMTEADPIKELQNNPVKEPFWGFFEPGWGVWVPDGPGAAWFGTGMWKDYEPGVSNPFYLTIIEGKEQDKENQTEIKDWIKENYLKNKPYLIIEMGTDQYKQMPSAKKGSMVDNNQPRRGNHNYFIMLVKGQSPRFMHLGYELRGIDGIGPGGYPGNKTDWRIKLRTLSECTDISVDDLLNQANLKIYIRQHLGDIIVTFSSHPGLPWKISREDFRLDNNSEVIRERYPMVIPAGTLRVHGGNMTAGVCFNHTVYPGKGKVKFTDRQGDIGEAKSSDIYATFANPGDNDGKGTSKRSRSKSTGIFSDPQFNNLKMGYSVDAYQVREIHQNEYRSINIYDIFRKNYQMNGREWACSEFLPNEVPTKLSLEVVRGSGGAGGRFSLEGIESQIGPDGKYIGVWDVAVNFDAGTIVLPGARDPILPTRYDVPIKTTKDKTISDGTGAILKNNVTPIATAWSLIILGGGKVITSDMTEDISEYVETISDGWTAEGFASINHEAKLTLYLPMGTGHLATDTKVNRILSLIDKTFYITISYWWQDGMGLSRSIQFTDNNYVPDTLPYYDPRLIQMTGICYGAEVERSVNKIKMSVEVKDYMEPLKQTFVWNCPFFDSVADVSAIYELAKMAGMNDVSVNSSSPGEQQVNGIDRRPLGFLQELMQTRVQGIKEPVVYNEEKHAHQYFALPGSYADVNDQAMKFPNGTPYKDIMEKLVKLYGKTIYFDRYGVLIVEVSPAKLTAFKRTRTDPNDPDSPLFDVDVEDLIKASFVTSPLSKIWDVASKSFVTFNSLYHTPFIVYNNYTVKRNVADAINHLSMYAPMSPDGGTAGLMAKGRTFYEQIWNPQAEGFFGYRKAMWHQDGIYGDEKSLASAMVLYARFKFPPLQISFETFGVPGLKPLDIVMLDRQPLYIIDINHSLDPKTNSWWMQVSGEWIKSFDDELLMPKTSEADITNPAE